jgi:hypothetical protein
MDFSPKGERAGASESIEVRVYLRSEESHASTITLSVPGGNGADGSRATWASARRGERTGVSESIEARAWHIPKESRTHIITETAFPAGIEPTFKV